MDYLPCFPKSYWVSGNCVVFSFFDKKHKINLQHFNIWDGQKQ
ncbi:MAG: hypothetical protein ACI976_002905, partial [Aureispira sp.]